MEEQEKTEVFASTFRKKWVLPDAGNIPPTPPVCDDIGFFVPVRPNLVRKGFKELDQDSGIGPDDIPSMVLKRMYMVLETPLTKIVREIIAADIWPDVWKIYWIFPLFKKGLT